MWLFSEEVVELVPHLVAILRHDLTTAPKLQCRSTAHLMQARPSKGTHRERNIVVLPYLVANHCLNLLQRVVVLVEDCGRDIFPIYGYREA